ncbi:MAG: rhomboid family intramembrane serine protease [Chloroflexi bacterium]|nr:MAG: rhomboid family intramembrane serine protease [Chloroflexota bacterium]
MNLSHRLARFPSSLAIACLILLTFGLQLAHDPVNTLLGRLTLFDLQYAFIPAFASEEPWRWITAPFVHLAPWHLLNNVAFVLILGSWLEEDLGSLRLAALFATGALAGEAIYLVIGQELDIVLGASAGLMAIGGAAIVTERRAPFAGALGLILPPPLRARSRQAAEAEKAAADWLEAKATIEPLPTGDAAFLLQPTRQRAVAVALTVVLIIVAGISIGLQSVFISDTTSATVAVVAAVWTVGIGILFWRRARVPSVRFDVTGMTGDRWRQAIQWSEVKSLYPGRVWSGLYAMGALGFIRQDGKRFTILGAGHNIRSLARRIEAIRLTANRANGEGDRLNGWGDVERRTEP